MRNRYIKQLAIKQLDMGSMLKGISSVKKSLVDANRQAMLAVDELEDYAYTTEDAVASVDNDAVQNVIKHVRTISNGLQKLVAVSDQAKQAIRDCMDAASDQIAVSEEKPAIQQPTAPDETVRYYKRSRKYSRRYR